LSPSAGNWNFSTLYAFPTLRGGDGPRGKLLMDAAGNLNGTSLNGGAYWQGLVFKLMPTNGGWEFMSLHDFQYVQGGCIPQEISSWMPAVIFSGRRRRVETPATGQYGRSHPRESYS
jgi:hypothetical protein